MAEEFPTMDSQASFARRRPPKSDKLFLEDYFHLLHSRQSLHLTMNQLNQVIRIHGFKKIHHAVKKVLIDAVESLDLVDLPRSTLCQSVSAFAAVSLDEAVADLGELNWQECCVTSVETLGSYHGGSGSGGGQSSLPTGVSSDQNLQLAIVQSHAHRTKRMGEIYGGLVLEASRRSMPAKKMVPKRKRSTTYSAASTVDSASLASC